MTQKRIFLASIGIIFVLLAGLLLYGIFRDNDPYQHFTGLGENISVAPDDSKIAFSYYVDGNESIYTANADGTNVEKITNSNNQQDDRYPEYSSNGERIVYLSRGPDAIQTLWVTGHDGSGRQLTDSEFHVTDAIFSQDGETIFFIAMKGEAFNQPPEESSGEGFDLFSIEADGGNVNKLTDADYFNMNHLSLSPDGNMIYFSNFDGENERIYSYSLADGTVNDQPSIVSEELVNERTLNRPQLSPEGEYLAFTEVSEESQDSSLFEYELFLLDLQTNHVERLTDLNTSVSSPAFFHQENKIAFLENTNWSMEPGEYQLKTIDLPTQNIETVHLDLPQSSGENPFIQLLDRSVNIFTISILYMLLVGVLSMYFHHHKQRKAYLPSIVSFSIAILTFAASVAVALMVNPWAGIALGMLAVGIFGCSVIVVLFVFIYRYLAK